ncbi:MAG: hypothetical protein MOB07_26225 [Acidobacteria bacterium]|nr:hypothetical protein [Acidobacteriota bacterium]
MRTVFEEAIEIGQTTFPRCWQAIQQMVESGADNDAIQASLREKFTRSRPSAKFWEWVDDAITAARHQSDIEANQRRRQFHIVKGVSGEISK